MGNFHSNRNLINHTVIVRLILTYGSFIEITNALRTNPSQVLNVFSEPRSHKPLYKGYMLPVQYVESWVFCHQSSNYYKR